MIQRKPERGFSLVEVLLVLAIMGILGGIAIPAYLGQRRRARVIGDAQSNARVLAMALETVRADRGTYGASGATVTYTGSGGRSGTDLTPTFLPKGNTQMNYKVDVGANGLVYTVTVTDPQVSNQTVLTLSQTGSMKLDPTYNK
jgi:prepilin-type N-terminal cleavage/methylation domain-containing protein